MAEIERKSEDLELEWTGERFVPGIEGDIAAEHFHRYLLACELVRGKDVLDIACGEGYGSNLLRGSARTVIGVDCDEVAVSHASARYPRPDLQFKVGFCHHIPLKDNSIDVVVSFETIEHHSRHAEMLSEIKRVLRPDGLLIISSPDKHEYSDVPGNINPYHVKELYFDEFHALLKTQFNHVELYGQRVDYGSIVAPIDSGIASSWLSFTENASEIHRSHGVIRPLFFIAVATNGSLASLPSGIFSDMTSVLRRDQQQAIQVAQSDQLFNSVRGQLNSAYEQITSLNQTVSERDGQIGAYQRQAGQFAEMLKTSQDELKTAYGEIISLRQSTAKANGHIDSFKNALDERDSQIRVLFADLARANSKLENIVSSKSWRFTRIFRRLKSLLSGRRELGVSQRQDAKPPVHFVLPASASHSLSEIPTAVPEPPDASPDRMRFDAEFYLLMYRDVRENFTGDPYEHYVAFGKAEGRLGCPPPFVYTGDFDRLNPNRDTVLVVSHEASTTGAPVLSLNIILELKAKYNVVAMVLKGGSLSDDLQDAADIVVGPAGSQAGSPGGLVIRFQLDHLLARCRLLFAIVNSIESRSVLPELARHFVPSVVLIHEFASYTRPHSAFAEATFWASEIIFSADIVRDNAVSAFPALNLRLPAVIPQGRCSHALTSPDESSSKREAERIRRIFRPDGWPEDTPVVLGVGSVHIRKGVDLFVACAARVSLSTRCRFIWIGSGFEPNLDMEYSVYLADQIERAGLNDSFAFVSETSQIDFAYEKADVLIVSSRLDPLPNVSIDAVSRGLPIVCFDKATGMADILRRNGLEQECVAPYLDVEEMAARVLGFLKNPGQRQMIGNRLREVARKTFNMITYVEQIESKALTWKQHSAQECLDCATISENSHLDLDYLAEARLAEPGMEGAVRQFVRSWESGFSLRKPYPGFHPGIYLEQCGIANLASNPLAHYMQSGSPEGPWCYDVLDPSLAQYKSFMLPQLSVALHLHIFYPDLSMVIIERLNENRVKPDLFISVPSVAVKSEMEILLRNYKGKTVDIRVTPNRGRDIGPFLSIFGERLTAEYEFVGHFHTKKTAELNDKSMGESWFAFLLENLIGGRYKMADTILKSMIDDPSIGLVFPDDPNVVGWTKNRELASRLSMKMEIPEPKDAYFNFPVGTMFWARSSAIQKLIALNLTWDDYPAEPLPPDGTVLHAIERLLPFVVDAANFRSVVTAVSGVTR